mmetsp:Transcript_12051/g.22426  ORF Transcript_12051/g.22426 Transcript_12051/m.22426 type:complete len:223 (+) Transcript_12051:807-1475(+)
MSRTHQIDLRRQLPPPRHPTPQQRQGRHRTHLLHRNRNRTGRPQVRDTRSQGSPTARAARSIDDEDEGSANDETRPPDSGAGMRVRGYGGEDYLHGGEREAGSGVFDAVEDAGSVESGYGGSSGGSTFSGVADDDGPVVRATVPKSMLPRSRVRHHALRRWDIAHVGIGRGFHIVVRSRKAACGETICGGARSPRDVRGVPTGAQRAAHAGRVGGGGEFRCG